MPVNHTTLYIIETWSGQSKVTRKLKAGADQPLQTVTPFTLDLRVIMVVEFANYYLN